MTLFLLFRLSYSTVHQFAGGQLNLPGGIGEGGREEGAERIPRGVSGWARCARQWLSCRFMGPNGLGGSLRLTLRPDGFGASKWWCPVQWYYVWECNFGFFFFLPQGGSGLGDILVENKFYLIVYNNNLGRKGVFSNHGLDGWPCSRIHSSSHPRGFPCT